jgi:hypothetical protein
VTGRAFEVVAAGGAKRLSDRKAASPDIVVYCQRQDERQTHRASVLSSCYRVMADKTANAGETLARSSPAQQSPSCKKHGASKRRITKQHGLGVAVMDEGSAPYAQRRSERPQRDILGVFHGFLGSFRDVCCGSTVDIFFKLHAAIRAPLSHADTETGGNRSACASNQGQQPTRLPQPTSNAIGQRRGNQNYSGRDVRSFSASRHWQLHAMSNVASTRD